MYHYYKWYIWYKWYTPLKVTIDTDNTTPVFAQLIDQIKQGVRSGQLAPGDSLPSIRQLANDLEVNSKTVAKAYRRLERDSVIQTRGYRGTFIHPQACANCTVDINGWAAGKLKETIADLKQAGVTDSEIRIAFSNAMNPDNSQDR